MGFAAITVMGFDGLRSRTAAVGLRPERPDSAWRNSVRIVAWSRPIPGRSVQR